VSSDLETSFPQGLLLLALEVAQDRVVLSISDSKLDGKSTQGKMDLNPP
jgi:hypothetical protein